MSKDIFKTLDKMNEDSAMLSEPSLSMVSEWIDTGCHALNVICSGSLYKGIPKGRIIGLAGPSQSGKSYIINKIIGKFQKMHPDNWAIIWDTEAAADAGAAKNVGADPDRIKIMPVETVEECRNQIVRFLDAVIEKGDDARGKYIIGIDSLGNLASTKEVQDAAAGKAVADMGLRARAMKSMLRTITYKAAKAGVTIVFANHTYDDPSALFPSMVKNQTGGKGPVYMASLLVQLSVTQDKEKNNEISPLANKVHGVKLSAMTVKNRFAPPFLKTTMYLNFKTGLDKYSGLLDMAVGYGVVNLNGPTYSMPDGTKLGFYKTWKNDPDKWALILPELERVIQEEVIYNNESELEQLEEEVKNLDD